MEHNEKSGHDKIKPSELAGELSAPVKTGELDDFLAKIDAENEALKKLHAHLTKKASGSVKGEPGDERA